MPKDVATLRQSIITAAPLSWPKTSMARFWMSASSVSTICWPGIALISPAGSAETSWPLASTSTFCAPGLPRSVQVEGLLDTLPCQSGNRGSRGSGSALGPVGVKSSLVDLAPHSRSRGRRPRRRDRPRTSPMSAVTPEQFRGADVDPALNCSQLDVLAMICTGRTARRSWRYRFKSRAWRLAVVQRARTRPDRLRASGVGVGSPCPCADHQPEVRAVGGQHRRRCGRRSARAAAGHAVDELVRRPTASRSSWVSISCELRQPPAQRQQAYPGEAAQQECPAVEHPLALVDLGEENGRFIAIAA